MSLLYSMAKQYGAFSMLGVGKYYSYKSRGTPGFCMNNALFLHTH